MADIGTAAKMKKYLVTGGAGFIGSHLVSYLATMGHQVRVLDDLSSGRIGNLRCQADLVVANVCDPDAVMHAASGCDGIFHLAAVTSVARSAEDCVGTHRVNQSATIAILDAARRHGNLPIVFASSAAIYGEQCPAMEHLGPAPRSAYGADKAGSELHLQAGWWSFGQPSAAMRFFNVFGPRQDPASPYSGVISVFLSRALARLTADSSMVTDCRAAISFLSRTSCGSCPLPWIVCISGRCISPAMSVPGKPLQFVDWQRGRQ